MSGCRRVLLTLLVSLVAAPLMTAPVEAQRQLAAIRGVVLDDSSRAVPGVTIDLTDPLGSVIDSTTSDHGGRFAIHNVAPGRYLLRATIVGFAPLIDAVEITAALPIEIVLRMALRTITEIRVDEGMLPDVPSTRTSIAGTTLAHIPVRTIAKGLQEAVATLPGWATEDNGLLHVRGSDDGFLYVIDGVPVYERLDQLSGLAPDLSTVESINVLTGYIPPEFGYKAGGVIEVNGNAPGRSWTGSLQVERGSDADSRGAISAGGPLNRRLSITIGAAAQRSDRFLDPVHPDNFHNHGDVASGTAQLAWLRPDADLVSAIAGGGRSAYEVPNTAGQEMAGQDQQQEVSQAQLGLAWQRVWSASAVSQLSAYVRRSSVRLHGSARDTPLYATSDRSLSRTGMLAGLSRRIGDHTVKAGFEIQALALDEDFLFAVTDQGAAHLAGFSDEALEFDLGQPFRFADRATPVLWSAYVQDDWTAGKVTIGAGVRFDDSRLLLARRQWSPRMGVAYRLAEQTLLRGSVSRFFQPPQPENLLLASSIEARELSPFAGDGEAGGADVEPERQWAFETGIEHRFGESVRVDAALWRRSIREAGDPNVFAATTIIFPNAVAQGRARGLDVRVEVQRWRSWSAYANASIARVRQRGPVTGGLFLEEEVAAIVSGGEFIPDHDQLLVASGGWTWTPSRVGASLSFTIRHETGTPVGSDEDDDVEDLRLRPGAETVDFDRGRVAARTVVSVQAELPIWRQGRRSVLLRAAVLNLFDARYAYNFGNPFSGTHFGAPRTASLAVRLGL